MRKPTILIVDDEPHLLKTLALILSHDFTVITASTAVEGLACFKACKPDIVILDLRMPEMSGFDVLNQIRLVSREVPVIIITGFSSHDSAVTCANSIVQGYFTKPLDIEKLLEKIKQILMMGEFPVLKGLWGKNYKNVAALLSPLTRAALQYIEDNCRNGISREEVAGKLQITADHLGRQFSKECGISLSRYIIMTKIDKSKKQLRESTKKISEIAQSLGFYDMTHFGKVFKEYTGMTPNEYRTKE